MFAAMLCACLSNISAAIHSGSRGCEVTATPFSFSAAARTFAGLCGVGGRLAIVCIGVTCSFLDAKLSEVPFSRR